MQGAAFSSDVFRTFLKTTRWQDDQENHTVSWIYFILISLNFRMYRHSCWGRTVSHLRISLSFTHRDNLYNHSVKEDEWN
jgi:hypothetical protein